MHEETRLPDTSAKNNFGFSADNKSQVDLVDLVDFAWILDTPGTKILDYEHEFLLFWILRGFWTRVSAVLDSQHAFRLFKLPALHALTSAYVLHCSCTYQ